MMIKIYKPIDSKVRAYLVVAPNNNHVILPAKTTVTDLLNIGAMLMDDSEKFSITPYGAPPLHRFHQRPVAELNPAALKQGK